MSNDDFPYNLNTTKSIKINIGTKLLVGEREREEKTGIGTKLLVRIGL